MVNFQRKKGSYDRHHNSHSSSENLDNFSLQLKTFPLKFSEPISLHITFTVHFVLAENFSFGTFLAIFLSCIPLFRKSSFSHTSTNAMILSFDVKYFLIGGSFLHCGSLFSLFQHVKLAVRTSNFFCTTSLDFLMLLTNSVTV